MPELTTTSPFRCVSITLSRAEGISNASLPEEPYPCLVWDHDGTMDGSQRGELARRLLQSNCRYAVCAGANSEAWHLAFDEQFVQLHLDEPLEMQDEVHVMTTSHHGESPDDVAFFFVNNTSFDAHDFRTYVVLHIGRDSVSSEVERVVREHLTERARHLG